MDNVRTILECPGCHAMLAFEYAFSNLKLCTCGRVVQRLGMQELQVEAGLNAVTVPGSYIQPGTTGSWKEKQFKVSGKMGVWFQETFFSYWCIVFNGGETGILAEGYGMYAVLLQDKRAIIKKNDLSRNTIAQVAVDTGFQLQKKSESFYWEVEGEIFFPNFSPNFELYEYASVPGEFITIFKWANHSIDSYTSNPVTVDELGLKNTASKNLPGKEAICHNCSQRIRLKTYPVAQCCACSNCGALYAIEKHQFQQKGICNTSSISPLLVIGTKGVLKGVEYEVVGMVEKEEQNSHGSKWREYTLFNAGYGFVFISEYDGHFIFLKEVNKFPVIINDNISEFVYNKIAFRKFNSYTAKVIAAKGEFPGNIFDNNDTRVLEYIAPPQIWIREKSGKEGITWFYGESIKSGEITKAFPDHGLVPYTSGVGAVEPSGHIALKKLIPAVLIALVFLLCVHLLLVSGRHEKVIREANYSIADSADKVSITTNKFSLNSWRSKLTFEITAPVNNSWFELNATLVNAVTGEEFYVEKGVEYYYGYSDGESWSEGSTSATAYMTGIPAGNYFLKLEGARERTSATKVQAFDIKIISDQAESRNFWFAVLLMLIWPVLNYVISNQSEKTRWSNSPFSTYQYD